MIEFAWPWAVALLVFPLLAYWILKPSDNRSGGVLRTSLFQQWQQFSNSPNKSQRFAWLHLLISFLLWSCLVAAIARPQWVGEAVELPASGRDLMVSMDISGSMEQQDLQLNGKPATRLWVVKHILAEFIEERQGDRLGLILFGENAYLQTPLTFDLKTINHMLMETEIGLAGASKTAIGDGIGLAVKRLKERPAQNRVLILLTDGQNNAGALEPIEAAKLAKHAGVKIYTIGVGADEMIIKDMLFGGARRINPSEELDESTLTTIAEMTGGRYFRARDEEELKQIYDELDQLEPIEKEAELYRPVTELYYYPLALALGIYIFLLVISQLWSLILTRRFTQS
ncbi:MAG: VWA domain-containing protein [Gammaproteobacteria bacterium]|nr:VWA domain-containing protein [Gammaproteobacteria bacterium]